MRFSTELPPRIQTCGPDVVVDAPGNTAYVPFMVDVSRDFQHDPVSGDLSQIEEIERVQRLIDDGIASGVLEIDAFEALAQVMARIPDLPAADLRD